MIDYWIQHLLPTTDKSILKLYHKYNETGRRNIGRPKRIWTYQYLRRWKKPQIGLHLVATVVAALPVLYQLLIFEMRDIHCTTVHDRYSSRRSHNVCARWG